MYSAYPIEADHSGATGDANCSYTFWQSMGFNKHAHGAFTDAKAVSGEAPRADAAEFARVSGERPVRVRESPLATGDGRRR